MMNRTKLLQSADGKQIIRILDTKNNKAKTVLKGHGVVMPDYEKRGSHDYRKDAVLTMQEFHRIVVRCIVHYNSERVITSYPYTADMLERRISPHAADIWNYKVSQAGANMIPVSEKELIMTLFPRTEGTFSRYGFKVNKLRYHAEGYKERYLSGGKAVAAYNKKLRVWVSPSGYSTR